MSCPKCGTELHQKSLATLLLITSLLIVSFGISLFVLPFELFFIFAFILLFGLRYIEREFNSIDKGEVRCSMCNHVANIAHIH